MSKDTKATIAILSFFVIFGLIIIIPLLISHNKKSIEEDKKNFPSYEEITIDESVFGDDSKYDDVREQLENDYYFSKFALIGDYDYKEGYKTTQVKDMLRYFIFNYEVENTKYMLHKNNEEKLFCLLEEHVKDGFKELYRLDVDDDFLSFMEQFYKYTYKSSGRYCFYYGQISDEFTKNISIGVERMAMSSIGVTADIYIYLYDTSGINSEKVIVSNLKEAIKNKNYDLASTITKDNLGGSVTHKQLQFMINSKGKQFKYQVLTSKILDY
jgi:hypothetical protein